MNLKQCKRQYNGDMEKHVGKTLFLKGKPHGEQARLPQATIQLHPPHSAVQSTPALKGTLVFYARIHRADCLAVLAST